MYPELDKLCAYSIDMYTPFITQLTWNNCQIYSTSQPLAFDINTPHSNVVDRINRTMTTTLTSHKQTNNNNSGNVNRFLKGQTWHSNLFISFLSYNFILRQNDTASALCTHSAHTPPYPSAPGTHTFSTVPKYHTLFKSGSLECRSMKD